MNYGNIKPLSIENGTGVRVSLFVSGCRNQCEGCFSKQTWDFSYGKEYTDKTKESLLAMLKEPYVSGLTLLGGEPMEPENQPDILSLVSSVKSRLLHKDIWMYSGFTLEEMLGYSGDSRCRTPYTEKILKHIDVLVDGKFQAEQKDISLSFRGSRNQRVLDVKKSLLQRCAVLYMN